MQIAYDEYELLNLFWSEPTIVGENGAGLYIYTAKDSIGNELVLSFSVYEGTCDIGLSVGEVLVFETGDLTDVIRLDVNGNCLTIVQATNSSRFSIYFNKDAFTVKYE